jgi:hypothetical protein
MRLCGTMLFVLLAGAAILGIATPDVTGQELPPTADAAPLPDAGTVDASAMASVEPLPTPMDGSARLVAALRNKAQAPTLVGKSGEMYEPSSEMLWQRSGAGGVSTDVQSIFKTNTDALFAVGSRAPLFRRNGGLWAAFPLGNKGRAAVSPGSLPIISVGRHIYQLSGSSWHRIASARGAVRALYAANANRFYVVTTKNQLFLGGRKSWQVLPIALPAGDQVRSLIGVPGKQTFALTVQHRLYSLHPKGARLLAMGPAFAGLEIHAMGAVGGRLLLAGRQSAAKGGKTVLAELVKSKIKMVAPLWPLEPDDHFSLITADHNKGLLVGTHQGQVRVQDTDGKWRTGEVQLAPPGPPEDFSKSVPARSK